MILELQLLLAAHLERPNQGLPFDGIPHDAVQMTTGDIAFHQIILHPLMQRLHGQLFVILAGKDHDRHAGRFLQYFAERIRAATVGKIQIEQHHRRRMLG